MNRIKEFLQKRKEIRIAKMINRLVTNYGVNPNTICPGCGLMTWKGMLIPADHVCGIPDHPRFKNS